MEHMDKLLLPGMSSTEDLLQLQGFFFSSFFFSPSDAKKLSDISSTECSRVESKTQSEKSFVYGFVVADDLFPH